MGMGIDFVCNEMHQIAMTSSLLSDDMKCALHIVQDDITI